MKTVYEERAGDLRILAEKEPNADTPETDKAVANEWLSPHPYIELARQLERERDDARRKYKRAEDYNKRMDAVIHDLKIAKSCINPLEDLKRATTALKERADKAEAALADAAGINSPHNACARLREDAARYCWLRDDKRGRMLSVSSLDWTGDPKLSDAAIDAARKDTK